VNFVSNGVINEAVTHVPADEVDRCEASDLLPICLPKRAVERPACVISFVTLAQDFAEFHLLEVHCQQTLALSAEVDRAAAVGIDDVALITPTAGNLIRVPPEVP
jgi:hypothetical protein